MKYKTELHCHSEDASDCSHESAEGIVEKYLAAGYSTICLTNHFGPGEHDETDWVSKVDKLFYAYEKLVKVSEGWLNIIMGMELRVTKNHNDYLVFGFNRKFLLDRPDLLKMTIGQFTSKARTQGILTIQAHPFRYGMTTVRPDQIDGVEVFNGHFGHESNNDIAESWAKKHRLIQTSGTDHHDKHHIPNGGIETDSPIRTPEELIAVLKSGNYRLLRG